MHLPEEFAKNIQLLLGEEAVECLAAIGHATTTTIRLNKGKPTLQFNESEQVEWYNAAKYLNDRPSFIADPLFHAGTYYVQESSSMFVGHVVKQLKAKYAKPVKVLDLCAAPGGKSTLVLDELTDDDLLVSNEIIKTRVGILEDNLVKWGRGNVVVTNNDPQQIGSIGAYFDIMLIDAPCSGEGMFRKDKNAISEWSEAHTLFCAQRQKRILSDALKALKPGGYLIYSTCTFNQAENEENVKWLTDEFGYRPEAIPIENDWGITHIDSYQDTPLHAYRFYPHKVKGEGLFLACLQKPLRDEKPVVAKEVKTPRLKEKEVALLSPWLEEMDKFHFVFKQSLVFATLTQHVNDVALLSSKLYVKMAGTRLGEVMKDKLVPDHQLALSIYLNKNIPAIEVDRLDALKYLKKDNLVIPGYGQGIYLITYRQHGLGWAKVLPNRINNYLPVNWRILKDLKDLI
ncbi:MAG: hypothetical protein V4658_14320 [Bacteroidota bacterium]